MYNFTVVIPHKNTPDLLQRCLDSIPLRDDLQVLIVDDNSDKSIVDFNFFPGVSRPDTKVVFSKEKKRKGPGYARNIGISKAEGNWIIFSDSDDYFTNSFNYLLDKYKNSEEEIIFFKCCRQNEEGVVSENYPMVNDAIDYAVKTNDTDNIVYGVPVPWGKFIKRNFLVKNAISYQEITGGDDILFSIRMAVNLKSPAFSDERLYCVADREGSLTRNSNWRTFYSYTLACIDAYGLLKPVLKEKMAVRWIISWWGFLWAENKLIALSLIPDIFIKLHLRHAYSCVKKGMKRGAWNWRNN